MIETESVAGIEGLGRIFPYYADLFGIVSTVLPGYSMANQQTYSKLEQVQTPGQPCNNRRNNR
jgi:hypothetical protein